MNRTEQVKVFSDNGITTIVGYGALDLYNEDFGKLLREASLSDENVVADLRLATYIDTAIIANLAGSAGRLLKRNKRLKVMLSEGTHPLRAIIITGLSEILDIVVENAQSGVGNSE